MFKDVYNQIDNHLIQLLQLQAPPTSSKTVLAVLLTFFQQSFHYFFQWSLRQSYHHFFHLRTHFRLF